MAYPKQVKQEDVNAGERAVAPAVPQTPRVVPPQAPTGGAPKVYPQRSNWRDASQGIGSNGRLPAASPMTLPQTQEQMPQYVAELRTRFDTLSQDPEAVARNPRFFNMYKQMPEPTATMIARRSYTDQVLGASPVADWMRWLEGNK